jgi:predicted helicase
VPELSQQIESLIKEERRRNPSFRNVFDDYYALSRQAINLSLSEEAVERMLVQHLLTERIFRTIPLALCRPDLLPSGTSSIISTLSCTIEYRQRYAANLRRELPRIPFASDIPKTCHPAAPPFGAEGSMQPAGSIGTSDDSIDPSARKKRGPQDDNAHKSSVTSVVKDLEVFSAFVKAGQRLADIHVHYEQQPEYSLKKIEKKGEKLDYRVEKMKLSKDKTQLIYNKFLTLADIPPETYEYRLGNRSALEWIVDQYQVSTDKRSGITNDPNGDDDPTYILRLIGQVITVSLETVRVVKGLPELCIAE